jgi:RNase P subunit RPR2
MNLIQTRHRSKVVFCNNCGRPVFKKNGVDMRVEAPIVINGEIVISYVCHQCAIDTIERVTKEHLY